MNTLDLSYYTRGNVSGGFKKEVSEVINDCYRRFASRAPYKVEVYIFDNEDNLNIFLRQEKFKHGLSYSAFDSISACTHDMLRGFPRLLICQEHLSDFSKTGRAGAIRHEAAHTILHGSLEYSIFQIPEDCRHVAMVKGIESNKLEEVFFQLSMAVKDFEATKLLIDNDYINCQFSYALEWIKPVEDDLLAWNISKTNRQTRFAYESALIRPILFASPLLALSKSKKFQPEQQAKLSAKIKQLIAVLGEIEEDKVIGVAGSIIGALGEDTHKNIDTAFHLLINLI